MGKAHKKPAAFATSPSEADRKNGKCHRPKHAGITRAHNDRRNRHPIAPEFLRHKHGQHPFGLAYTAHTAHPLLRLPAGQLKKIDYF